VIVGARILLVAVEAAGRQRRHVGGEQVDLAIDGERVHVDELDRVVAARRPGHAIGEHDLAGVTGQPPHDVEQRFGLCIPQDGRTSGLVVGGNRRLSDGQRQEQRHHE